MSLAHAALGKLYIEKGGLLEQRCLGAVLHLTRQILDGGIGSPTTAQTNWANATKGLPLAAKRKMARETMEWGLANNATLQSAGAEISDNDLSYIVAEFSKTYSA